MTLVTTNVLDTKIGEAKDEIPVVSDLVKEMNYDAKVSDIKGKYITTSDYNNFMRDILDPKIKQKELVNKSDISNHIKSFELNTKLVTLATKAELKAK